MKFSVELKSHYKFSIACENAKYYGYTSEKLLTSFAAHTVPIYWGNPAAAQEYNPEAFINCHDYPSFEEIIKRIREVDENDDLWAYMVSQPWQTEEQINAAELEQENYKKFIANVFTQPLDKAKRRPEGTWPDRIYAKCFERGLPKPPAKRSLARKILGAIRHPSRIKRRLFPVRVSKPALKTTDINDFFKDD